MSTLGTLKTTLGRQLRDPGAKAFSSDDLSDFINSGVAQASRFAPRRFSEDIDYVAGEQDYAVQAASVDSANVDLIEVRRVEQWDTLVDPAERVRWVQPASAEYVNSSETGWGYWGGSLHLPQWLASDLVAGTHVIRVWGYAPYAKLTADEQSSALSDELEDAVMVYARLQGLTRLMMDRDLFTQWQTRANNTDVSPAALLSALNLAQEDWRRLKRDLTVLREAP